jgi:hypothetical protein
LIIGQPRLVDDSGGSTGRFLALSRRRWHVGETWFPHEREP